VQPRAPSTDRLPAAENKSASRRLVIGLLLE
jgi:hypothetical protein